MKNRIADYHVSRGDRALAHEDMDAALREFEAALTFNPQLAPAYSKIAQVHKQRGDYEKAVAYFAEAVRIDPFEFINIYNLAQLHQLLAATAADRAAALESAVRAYLHACDLRPDHFESQLNLGVCYHQLGRIDAAVECYRKAVALNPRQAFAYVNLGAAYESQGKFYEAIRAYKNALECDGKQPVVHVNLGTIYVRQGRYSAAVGSFELALKLDPKLAMAHERRAYCRYREGQYDESLTGYNRAIELDPRRPESYAGRGVVEMTLYLQNTQRAEFRQRAIEDWHASLELDPQQPRLRELLAKYAPPPSPDDENTAILSGH